MQSEYVQLAFVCFDHLQCFLCTRVSIDIYDNSSFTVRTWNADSLIGSRYDLLAASVELISISAMSLSKRSTMAAFLIGSFLYK